MRERARACSRSVAYHGDVSSVVVSGTCFLPSGVTGTPHKLSDACTVHTRTRNTADCRTRPLYNTPTAQILNVSTNGHNERHISKVSTSVCGGRGALGKEKRGLAVCTYSIWVPGSTRMRDCTCIVHRALQPSNPATGGSTL